MAAVIDNWTGPGSGGPTLAPNTFWWFSFAASQTVSTKVQFFNAAGALVTVNATFQIWDVGSGTQLGGVTLSGVNTMTLGPDTMTSGHTYAHRITYNGGTSCDHCICSVTAIGASTSGHTIFSVRRSGAWVGIPGHQIRVRRGGAWAIVNNGVRVRRTGAWAQP